MTGETRGQVVVVGSINVDLVVRVDRLPKPGETVTRGVLERHGGGKGANAAVAAARAGGSVRFIGAVGEDDFGEQALADLEAAGVDVSGVQRLGGIATGVALIVVAADGENMIAVASGANAELSGAAVEQALGSVDWSSGTVCLLNLEIPDEPLLAAARSAARGGARAILLDPAPAREFPTEIFDAHAILTPNAGELETLGGDPRALSARTSAPVVVTAGADGALLVTGDGQRRIEAPTVEAVDTTGAGDAFNGTLGAALARGCSIEAAVELAVTAAAESVTRPGAR